MPCLTSQTSPRAYFATTTTSSYTTTVSRMTSHIATVIKMTSHTATVIKTMSTSSEASKNAKNWWRHFLPCPTTSRSIRVWPCRPSLGCRTKINRRRRLTTASQPHHPQGKKNCTLYQGKEIVPWTRVTHSTLEVFKRSMTRSFINAPMLGACI